MKYSLRNLMWGVVVACLATALGVMVYKTPRYISPSKFATLEKIERAQLRALHEELDKCYGKGNWSLERDDSGTLVVKRPSE